MTSNITAFPETNLSTVSLLWVPHVAIAVSFLTFLAINFYCYHMKYRQRYQRHSDKFQVKARLKERRRILNIVKLRQMIRPHPPISVSTLSAKNFKPSSTLSTHLESTLTSKSSSNLRVHDDSLPVIDKSLDAISV